MKQNRMLRCCLMLTAAMAISGCASHQNYDPIVVVPKESSGTASSKQGYEIQSGFWFNNNGNWVWAPTGGSLTPTEIIVSADVASPATQPLSPETQPAPAASVATAPQVTTPATEEPIAPPQDVLVPDPSANTATTAPLAPPVEPPAIEPLPPTETPIEEPTPPVGGAQEP